MAATRGIKPQNLGDMGASRITLGTPSTTHQRRWIGVVAGLFVVACGGGLVACAPEQTVLPGEASRRAVTAHVADRIVAPLLERAARHADTLVSSVSSGDLSRARDAWHELMQAWQGLEMLHLGPGGSPTLFVGGAGMRDGIYAWPQVNLCAVDAQLISQAFEEPGWIDARLPNVIGLAALEYVLFVEGTASVCPSSAALVMDGSWAALSADELAKRRLRYATVLAPDVKRRIQMLRDAWTPAKAGASARETDTDVDAGAAAGFAAALRAAGDASSPFPTAQHALNDIFAALFAVDLVTKDKRLGVPAGLHAPMGGDACAGGCVERAESRFAEVSKDNVLANLITVRAVFTGTDEQGVEGPGLDDLLVERGAQDLAANMTTLLDAAIAEVTRVPGTLEGALAATPASVIAAYDAVKLFTDEMKSTLPSALGLRVPDEGAGDND